MKTIVAFTGKIGSGKAFQMMKRVEEIKTNGNEIFLISFADPIKKFFRENFGLEKSGICKENIFAFNPIYIKGKLLDSLYENINFIKDETNFKNLNEMEIKKIIYNIINKYEKIIINHIINSMKNNNYEYHFRNALQIYGTELGRSIIDDIWIKIAFKKIKTIFMNNLCDYVFIDDLRFLNEYEILKKKCIENNFKFECFGVIANDEIRAKRRNISIDMIKTQGEHISEQEIDKIIEKLETQYIIENN